MQGYPCRQKAGFSGVEKAIRALREGNSSPILRLNYQRNTVDVDDAVVQLQQMNAQLQQKKRLPIKVVIMVPTPIGPQLKFVDGACYRLDFCPGKIQRNAALIRPPDPISICRRW
jgi:hypothetical protein